MTGLPISCFLTQPAISQQIRNLEDDLGLNCLCGVRQIKPTLQGEVLYDYAKDFTRWLNKRNCRASDGCRIKGATTCWNLWTHRCSFDEFHRRPSFWNIILSWIWKSNMSAGKSLSEVFQEGFVGCSDFARYGRNSSRILKMNKISFERRNVVGWSGKDTEIPMPDFHEGLTITIPSLHFLENIPISIKSWKPKCKPGYRRSSHFESSNVGTLKRVIEKWIGFFASSSIRKQVRMGRKDSSSCEGISIMRLSFITSPKGCRKSPCLRSFYQALQQIREVTAGDILAL